MTEMGERNSGIGKRCRRSQVQALIRIIGSDRSRGARKDARRLDHRPGASYPRLARYTAIEKGEDPFREFRRRIDVPSQSWTEPTDSAMDGYFSRAPSWHVKL